MSYREAVQREAKERGALSHRQVAQQSTPWSHLHKPPPRLHVSTV